VPSPSARTGKGDEGCGYIRLGKLPILKVATWENNKGEVIAWEMLWESM